MRRNISGRNKIFIFLGILIFIIILSVQRVDYRNYHDLKYFTQSIEAIRKAKSEIIVSDQGPLQIGWAVATLTPAEPVRLTGLRFSAYEGIRDSVSLKTFVFSNTESTIVFISYDLWIIHPTLSTRIKESIKDTFPQINGIYLTATHSHSSIGGWASGLLGNLVVGGNSDQTLNFIENRTIKSVETALSTMQNASLGYAKIKTDQMVVNRLNRIDGPVDDYLRLIKFKKGNGQYALLSSYSAHSVYLSKDVNLLSGDYPGPFTEALSEGDSIEMAAFAAGAMGSHTPIIINKDDSYEAMIDYSEQLASYVESIEEIPKDSSSLLSFIQIPIEIPPVQIRISENWRLKPWIFHGLMGKYPATITYLRLGNTLLIGLPIELSGEFYYELEKAANKKGLNLMITSFNGTYLGYAPKGEYYNRVKKAETRTMNWYGPHSGEYFSSLIDEIILQL